jgi:hypothetical protein
MEVKRYHEANGEEPERRDISAGSRQEEVDVDS